jgi:hypothetical protein
MSRQILLRLLVAVMVVAAVFICVGGLSAQGRSSDAFERVREVQQRHTAKLMAQKGVVGTAVGLSEDGRPAMLVLLEETGVAQIPAELDGVSVRTIVTGKIEALAPGKAASRKGPPQNKLDPKDRFARPVPIGVSTGNAGECSAGTIACRVTKGAAVYALSNNHVYALENEAAIDSEVVQPGLYDTRCRYSADNVIGALARFEPIEFSTSASNTIDAAIAVSSEAQLGNSTPADGYGTPSSETMTAAIGMAVQKYGRTTALTQGTVTGTDAIVNVGYSSGTARFVDQIIVQSRAPFIKAGDSGSLVVTSDGNHPVALVFAGDSSGKFAVANHIDDVLDAFRVTIDGQ